METLETTAETLEINPLKLPSLGQVFHLNDPDSCIEAYRAIKELLDRVYYWNTIVKTALMNQAGGRGRPQPLLKDLTETQPKTRRVIGKRQSVKVTMPGTSFDQSVLKTLWNKYPALSAKYLRIGKIEVQRREAGKLKGAHGDEDLMDFIADLRDAEHELMGLPTISLEDPS
jgi:hypothetical protein